MNRRVTELRSPWQLASDLSERIAGLMDDIPAGEDGYESGDEIQRELREAAALLEQAAAHLRLVREREAPRYDRWLRRREGAGLSCAALRKG